MQYLTSETVQKWRAKKGIYVPPGGGAPPEINDVTERIDAVIVRTAGEKDDATARGKNYAKRSECFAQRVKEAIMSNSEEQVRERIPAIESCQLTKVEILRSARR
jgi:hypothetical protein